MIRIAEPKTLKNQHIISLKIEVFICIGSQTKEFIDSAADYIEVDDGCWRQTGSHQHQLLCTVNRELSLVQPHQIFVSFRYSRTLSFLSVQLLQNYQ